MAFSCRCRHRQQQNKPGQICTINARHNNAKDVENKEMLNFFGHMDRWYHDYWWEINEHIATKIYMS